MKGNLKLLGLILLIIIIIALAFMFDIYRWHTFQDVTNSDIGYWKWKFLFDNHKK